MHNGDIKRLDFLLKAEGRKGTQWTCCPLPAELILAMKSCGGFGEGDPSCWRFFPKEIRDEFKLLRAETFEAGRERVCPCSLQKFSGELIFSRDRLYAIAEKLAAGWDGEEEEEEND